MIDYLRNLFISWFNKILNWFSERQKKEMNTKKEIPFGKNKHADDDRAKRISEGFQALDEGCKSIANLRAEIEMSQTESKTFKDNEPKVNNDLDAPVPANNNGTNVSSLCYAPDSHGYCRVAKKEGNNLKNNLEEDKMGNFPIKGIKKFFCGPSNSEECEEDIKKKEEEMEKLKQKHEEFLIKEGKKIIPSNISPISMRSNNDNSNWMDPNDLNNTFEYQDEKVQKAMKGENNKMGELINNKAEKIKQEIKKDMDDKFAESTNKINQIQEQFNKHEEKINKNTEDIKKNTEDIKKIQEEQIDIKKMLAEMKEERKDTKRMLAKMEEDKKAHDELMAALWNKLDEWNGIKEPTREGSDNRESTNTSLSSFKYKNPFRNNTPTPKMEQPDMAHSYDENQ